MNVRMIGAVKYCEVEKLIKKIQRKPMIEKRGGIFRKRAYNVYFSFDNKYSLAFKYKGDFHLGSTFYSLTLETREKGNIIIKKDFGSRIFICDYYISNYPWAEFCSKFYLLEIEERPDNKSCSHFIKIYDADNNAETVVAKNGCDTVLAWSKNATHIIHKVYHKDNSVDLVMTDL